MPERYSRGSMAEHHRLKILESKIDPQKSLWIFIMWCKSQNIPNEITNLIVQYTPRMFKDDNGYLWQGTTEKYQLKQYWWSCRYEGGGSNFPACKICKQPCYERECHIDHAEFTCPQHGKQVYY